MNLYGVLSFITLQVVSGKFMRMAKQGVNMNNIVDTIKDTTITSCQLECNRNMKCDYIGFKESIYSGLIEKCNLISKRSASNGSRINDLYVIRGMEPCEALSCRSDQDCIADVGDKYRCVCSNGYVGDDCKTISLSCQVIKARNPFLKSGMYKINPSNPVTVYCDMEYDDRGWMMIANVTILNNALSGAEKSSLLSDGRMSNDISELNQVGTGSFRLNPTVLANFDNKFKYLRFYCHKPNGYTISIATTDTRVLDYFMLKTNTKPTACGSYIYDKRDNSRLSRMCKDWMLGTWAGLSATANRIYAFPFYVGGKYHYGLTNGRIECDDYTNGGTAGVWMIYVL